MEDIKDKHPGYFQGILQLRNPSKELIKLVKEKVKEEGIYIAKEVKLKNGIDMKISSNKFLLKLGKLLREKFNGDLKISKKIYSKDNITQKRIWRMTIMFKQVDFKPGDKVLIRGTEYKVNHLGSKVHCTELKTGKKKFFEYDEV